MGGKNYFRCKALKKKEERKRKRQGGKNLVRAFTFCYIGTGNLGFRTNENLGVY